ncbi:MFS transporter [Actinomyces sp. 2119]|uniref:RbtT/DalT/CsbX family MFS transporter n=1 Tax=Actinomyces sp. 2119 TaxID=2321393 RepID=UPI000E6C06F4|nr:RbtT/DalT/CsbX family MFS transporter [Actinomyces sp. 2119]RJF41998.1 MFS transporter [Actinomyces sp. 2119]
MPSSNPLVAAIQRTLVAAIQRTGFPTNLALGFLAVIIFVIGDGIEAVWIVSYLSSDAVGFATSQGTDVYTAYGVVVAIGAFLSGALCDGIGPRRVMLIGFLSFMVFDFLFIAVGLPSGNLPLVMVFYGARGLGYPMLAYGFLTWVMMVTPTERQGAASGWFWFAFSLGMQLLGSWLSSLLLNPIGHIATLWLGLVLAGIGGTILWLFLLRHPSSTRTTGVSVATSLFEGVSVLWRHPKVSLMGIVKVINLSGQYGMQAYYLVYLHRVYGMPEADAARAFAVFGLVAIIGDVVWGVVGDQLGWRNTLQWIAAPLTGASLVYLYFIPMVAGPNFWLVSLGMAAIGIGLSAHVPTTPLVMAHAKGETGNSLAILNLGAGLGAFVGPGIVSLLLIGDGNTAGDYAAPGLALAGIYGISFILLFFLKLPGNARVLHEEPEIRDKEIRDKEAAR